MKIVGLLRHAKSDWSDMDKRDFDRGLNDRGRQGAALIGQHIADHGVAFDRVVASPARRVAATLDAVMGDTPIQFDQRLYLAPADTLMEVLQDQDDGDDAVLLVAHNPGLQDLVLKLVARDKEGRLFQKAKAKYPTAAFAVIHVPVTSWRDLVDESGELTHFARPRDLDPELGPTD